MFDLDKEGIQKAIESIGNDRQASVQAARELRQRISELSQSVKTEEGKQQDLNHKESCLATALIILDHWPVDVIALREQRSEFQQQAGKDDITVLEQKRAIHQVGELTAEIQKRCKHPFVIGYRGYEGSYSYDYDDGYCGKRLCVVCGITEYSDEKRHAIYSMLNSNGERLIADTFLDKEKGYDATQPFEELVKSWIPQCVYELQK